MNEPFEYSGFWWLPETSENYFPGQLRFTPTDGIVLELHGHLHAHSEKNFSPPLILGVSREGKQITLQHCQLTKTRHAGSYGYDTSLLTAEVAFRGTHFQNPESIQFKSLSVRYAYLDEWFLTTDFDVQNNIYKGEKLTIQYIPPHPIKVRVAGYEIALLAKWRTSHNFHKQITLNQEAWIRFSPEELRLFETYLDIVYHIRNFLSLALSVPTYPLSIAGTTEADEPVDVFYQQTYLPTEFRLLTDWNMLFKFSTIEKQFETYILNWFSALQKLAPVYDLYFASLYNPYQYVQSTFLNLTQAIETYHRRTFLGKYQSDEEYLEGLYKRLVEAIPKEIDNDFRNSLKKGSLYYANQFSQRKRLKMLTNELSRNLSIGFISTPQLREAFVKRVCDVRNYLTHYDPNQQIEIEPNELPDLTEKLGTLLSICLLKELGFSYPDIEKMTYNHWKYKRVFRWY